jgi:hypothetical protein
VSPQSCWMLGSSADQSFVMAACNTPHSKSRKKLTAPQLTLYNFCLHPSPVAVPVCGAETLQAPSTWHHQVHLLLNRMRCQVTGWAWMCNCCVIG